MIIFKRNNDTRFLWLGGFLSIIFMGFNIEAAIKPYTLRAIKFFKMKPGKTNFKTLIEEEGDKKD